jgi:hypothetical protein
MNLGSQTMINQLIARKALLVINHPRGKDSQAMMIEPLRRIPREQPLVAHASLGEIEWHGAPGLAQAQAAEAGVPFQPPCIGTLANCGNGSRDNYAGSRIGA